MAFLLYKIAGAVFTAVQSVTWDATQCLPVATPAADTNRASCTSPLGMSKSLTMEAPSRILNIQTWKEFLTSNNDATKSRHSECQDQNS
jgi:hypothetical protein